MIHCSRKTQSVTASQHPFKLIPSFLLIFVMMYSGFTAAQSQCQADFYGDPLSGCEGTMVTFYDKSQDATSWEWIFEGGTPSTAKGSGPHNITYNTAGTYSVKLSIQCKSGSDEEIKLNYIAIYDCSCDPDFSANQTTICRNQTVTFTDHSDGADNWVWLFEGGTPYMMQGQGPHTITYNQTGQFDVSLEINCPNVGTRTETKPDYIIVKSVTLYDYGDAPESVVAYPADGTLGEFPTCASGGPAGYIRHRQSSTFLGNKVDYETEGNEGSCPVFANAYDKDEQCDQSDSGLWKPDIYTVQGDAGFEEVTFLCDGFTGDNLGRVDETASWGGNENINLYYNTDNPDGAYINVLIDWNQDGDWNDHGESPENPEEHILSNFHVPVGGAFVSAFDPPDFSIGPNSGYVWARMTITEAPVTLPWDGSGDFDNGETEDHLLRVGMSGYFQYRIDPDLQPSPATIPAAYNTQRKVGAIQFPEMEVLLNYVEQDLLFKPQKENDLIRFLEDYDGDVIHDGSMPDPPAKIAHQSREIPETTGWYRIGIHLDSTDVDSLMLVKRATALGYIGMHVFNSYEMLAAFDAYIREKSVNSKIALNTIVKPGICPTSNTQEFAPYGIDPSQPNGGHYSAYGVPLFRDPNLRVTKAWMLMDVFNRTGDWVNIAVIDRGFHMNQDFPSRSPYDFAEGDRTIDVNEEDYHGERVASLCAAELDNQYGFAGTGSQVAHLFPFRIDWSVSNLVLAIRTAVYWGADVVNLSVIIYSSEKEHEDYEELNDAVDEAFNNQAIVVACAGNENVDLGAPSVYYAIPKSGSAGKHPIVVGAINLITKEAITLRNDSWGSNYGSAVDIWAPGGPSHSILTTPIPPATGITDISHFSGTSAASPYIAGIVAMMKSFNKGIRTDEVRAILNSTANVSSHPRVTKGYVNALGAVKSVCQDLIPPTDSQEPSSRFHPIYMETAELCGNVSSEDLEDSYWFHLDDFWHVTVIDTPIAECEDYTTRLRGPHFSAPVDLPRRHSMIPGIYYIDLTHDGESFGLYWLSVQLDSLEEIPPDRFEENDFFMQSADLTIREEDVGEIVEVQDLTFHTHGDADFFTLQLPDLPDEQHEEQLTLYFESDNNGNSAAQYWIQFFDNSGRMVVEYTHDVTLDNIRSHWPDGMVHFSVLDADLNRNYYQIRIGYDQWIRRVQQPPQFSLMEVPDWFEAMAAMPFNQIPPAAAPDIPIPFNYPSDPDMIKNMATGTPTGSLSPEMLILKWYAPGDLDIHFYSSQLDFSLIGEDGEVIAEDHPYVGPLPKSMGSDSSVSVKRMTYEDLPRGFYGIKVTCDEQTLENPIPFTMMFDTLMTTSIEEPIASHNESKIVPEVFALSQNYPNPFNPVTTIQFDIPKTCRINLSIYNISGQLIETLMAGNVASGQYQINWDAANQPTGIYFYKLQADNFSEVKRMILMK